MFEPEPVLDDPLRLADAGPRTIRGGVIRVGGYLVGSGLAAAASILLLRYLGVADYGRYAAVMSLIAVVTGLTDIGLTLVGQREYVLRDTDEKRRHLTADILGIRLVITPIAIGLAVAFAVVVGYRTRMVLGTLIAGASVMFANAALTFTIPLVARLKFTAMTGTEVGRQVINVIGNALLVGIGAGLLGFFGVQVVAAFGALVLTAMFLGRRALARPRFRWERWRPILREAAPMGAAVIVGALYLRTLVVIASVLSSAFETGLFATSYRVLEILVAVPALMVGTAFPIMASAGHGDETRLADVLQQLLEASLLVAVLLVVVLTIAADPIVRILGGPGYSQAAPVLRIQCFALLGSFASVVWTTGLVAVRRQSALIFINGFAFTSVLVLGGTLIPLFGAVGAAVAAVAGEALLAVAALVMLIRVRPALRPSIRFLRRLLPPAALAALCALVPGVPALADAALAAAVFTSGAALFGAVPSSAVAALSSWHRAHLRSPEL